MATIEQVLVIKIHCPPCPREGHKNYILKIYPPGGCEIKKEGGCFLRYVLAVVCGYFNRGRGLKCSTTCWHEKSEGEILKVMMGCAD